MLVEVYHGMNKAVDMVLMLVRLKRGFLVVNGIINRIIEVRSVA